ncbi:MAG: effector-associated domain EAD1-containing protein [Capsulimonadaceae bacterium]
MRTSTDTQDWTAPSDSASELEALGNALRIARGFSLFFARCNQAPERDRLIEAIRARLSDERIEVRTVPPDTVNLIRTVQFQPVGDADILFFVGLESLISLDNSPIASHFIANLNFTRDRFPQSFPVPVVFWAPEHVVARISRDAPDFFSVASGLYSFADVEDVYQPATDLREAAGAAARLAELEQRLDAFYALPTSQRDKNTETGLLLRVADSLADVSRFREAQGSKITLRMLMNDGIFQELVERFGTGSNARILLASVGFPESGIPMETSAPYFWFHICKNIDGGVLQGGFELLLQCAHEIYPYNDVFKKYVSHMPDVSHSWKDQSSRITLRVLIEHGIFQELVRCFGTGSNARILLDRVGFPERRIPMETSAQDFWLHICKEIDAGAPTDFEHLLRCAREMYPRNPILGEKDQSSRITLGVLIEHGIFQELVTCFGTGSNARILLARVGFPESRIPMVTSAPDFWFHICNEIDAGASTDFEHLLRCAREMCPRLGVYVSNLPR